MGQKRPNTIIISQFFFNVNILIVQYIQFLCFAQPEVVHFVHFSILYSEKNYDNL